jgi:branched-chain amino acid transport system ATP-binding protein
MGAFLRKDKQGIQNDFERVYSLFPVLSERRSQVAGTLSGGEQQMLAIGRSLMSKPKLMMMMDEPSIGLSPLVKNQLADSIVDIWKSGITVLIVEQDASLTLELTQRVYIMEHGKVGLEGKSDELIDKEEVKRVYFQLG